MLSSASLMPCKVVAHITKLEVGAKSNAEGSKVCTMQCMDSMALDSTYNNQEAKETSETQGEEQLFAHHGNTRNELMAM